MSPGAPRPAASQGKPHYVSVCIRDRDEHGNSSINAQPSCTERFKAFLRLVCPVYSQKRDLLGFMYLIPNIGGGRSST